MQRKVFISNQNNRCSVGSQIFRPGQYFPIFKWRTAGCLAGVHRGRRFHVRFNMILEKMKTYLSVRISIVSIGIVILVLQKIQSQISAMVSVLVYIPFVMGGQCQFESIYLTSNIVYYNTLLYYFYTLCYIVYVLYCIIYTLLHIFFMCSDIFSRRWWMCSINDVSRRCHLYKYNRWWS